MTVRKEVESDESEVIPGWRPDSGGADEVDADEEWPPPAPLIPPAKHGGRKRRADVREAVNGRSKLCKQSLRRVMYVLSTGWRRRYVAKDLQ